MPERVASKSYGTVSADRRQEMSGLEFVQGLADGALPLNTIAKTLGYDVAEAVSGRVVVTAVPTAALLNPAGTVHGGFTATLLDSCMGLAVQSTLEKGVSQTTLEFKISLVRPITPETGLIKAGGVVVNRGRRGGTAEGRVTDDKGRLRAHGTTTCLIFYCRWQKVYTLRSVQCQYPQVIYRACIIPKRGRHDDRYHPAPLRNLYLFGESPAPYQ